MSGLLAFVFPVVLVGLVFGAVVAWVRSGDRIRQALRGDAHLLDERAWLRALDRELAREMDKLDRPRRRR